ncbi:Pentatricopeptide repeat [Dillenia turbinata]|uniref:Pentatricopeptide repeat n=1 Tax=Dillenia turbinata TaxID=194707 RepID=A0AAN8ZMK4_9MAGN
MLKLIDKGRQLCAYRIKGGFETQSFVGNALINMYAADKSEIKSVLQVFGSMNENDLVSWCTMMTACAWNGHETEALSLFTQLYHASIFSIDESILSTCLTACAGLSDMYSKSGSIEGARKLFHEINDHSLVSRTAMISGYAHHGPGHEAIKLFNEMVETGLDPDEVTFVYGWLNVQWAGIRFCKAILVGIFSNENILVKARFVKVYKLCGVYMTPAERLFGCPFHDQWQCFTMFEMLPPFTCWTMKEMQEGTRLWFV